MGVPTSALPFSASSWNLMEYRSCASYSRNTFCDSYRFLLFWGICFVLVSKTFGSIQSTVSCIEPIRKCSLSLCEVQIRQENLSKYDLIALSSITATKIRNNIQIRQRNVWKIFGKQELLTFLYIQYQYIIS